MRLAAIFFARPLQRLLRLGHLIVAAMSNRVDDHYDQRGTRQPQHHETMNRILQFDNYDTSIFQAGWLAAQDLERLQAHNIGFVINCAGNVVDPEWRNKRGTPDYLRFPIYDRLTGPLDCGQGLSVLEPLFRRIHDTLRIQRQSVMIHCRAGAHRAGTMGVILAMHFLDLNPSDASRHVRKRRSATHIVGNNLDIVCKVAAEMAAVAAPNRLVQPKARPAGPVTAAPAAPQIAPTPRARLTAAPAAPKIAPTELARGSSSSGSSAPAAPAAPSVALEFL